MTESGRQEKVAGYIIMLTFFAVFGWLSLKTLIYFFGPNEELVVYFPRIGELKTEQPLMYNGIEIGYITGFEENVYDGVAVTIRMNRTIPIREGYQFYSEDIDLFGYSRRVAFINGPVDAPVVSVDKRHHGKYYVGLPEIISAMGKLDWALNMLKSMLKEYMDGDRTSLRFFVVASDIQEQSSTILTRFGELEAFLDSDIKGLVKKVEQATASSVNISRVINKELPQVRNSIDESVNSLSSIIDGIPLVLDAVDSVIVDLSEFESDDKSEPLIKELQQIQGDLDKLRLQSHNLKILLRKY